MAPKDKHIIQMGTFFPYQFNGMADWKELKESLSLKNIELLNKMLPGIKNYIEFYDAAGPTTLYRYTMNSEGALYGWEQNPAQVFLNAFPSTSKINNLILAGHWTFPGEVLFRFQSQGC